MKELWTLFFTFFKIGAVSFGGGYAMLPMLERELVDKRKWTTTEALGDYYALSQCTPGVIAVNVATIIGYKRKHVIGGIIATIGVVTAPMIVITIIAAILNNFAHIPMVQDAFAGIRACVCVLIFNAVVKLWKSAIVDKTALVIYAVVLSLAIFTNISTFILVICAGLSGLGITAVRKAGQK